MLFTIESVKCANRHLEPDAQTPDIAVLNADIQPGMKLIPDPDTRNRPITLDTRPIITAMPDPQTRRKSSIQRATSTKSPAVKNEVIARRAIGQSKAQIAEALSINPHTVTSIIGLSDIDSLIENGRLSVAKLIPKSVNVLDQRLDKCSESAATTILSGIGVLRSKSEVNINIAANSSSSWYQRKQAISADPMPDSKQIEASSVSATDPSKPETD